MYLVTNKNTGKVELIGSIKSVAKFTGVKVDKLYEQFSRKKVTEFDTENFTIEKKQLLIAKRNAYKRNRHGLEW